MSGNSRNYRYAFVVPRFGRGIAGGAETLVGALARELSLRGQQVEVLTTCARDNRSWENDFPAGVSQEDGLTVSRFPVNPRNLDIWIPRQISISQGFNLSLEDQFAWMQHGVNSDKLYSYISQNAHRFDLIFFAPYLFSTTFWGSLICPRKSVLIPCLHDEHYAYVPIIGSMFRQVLGALFNSVPEQHLATRLYGSICGGEVGMGFEPQTGQQIDDLRPYFKEDFPYLLYLGRKETGKNVQLLLDYFVAAKGQGQLPENLKLVVAGGGDFSDLERPEYVERSDIIDLAHLSEDDKKCLLKFALVLCQPSVNESFSIVIMESWLLRTPVLVHSAAAVTKHHVLESGGGLYFSDQVDFIAMVNTLLQDGDLLSALASGGQRYVREKYAWTAVLERFDRVIDGLMLVKGESDDESVDSLVV